MNRPKSIFTSPQDFTRKPVDSPSLANAPSLIRRRSTPEIRAESKVTGGIDATQAYTNALLRHHSFHSPSNQSTVEGRSWTRQESPNQLATRQKGSSPSRPAFAQKEPPKTPGVSGKKRSLVAALAGQLKEPNSEPNRKSARIGSRSRHTLNRYSFSGSTGTDHEPPSPLFFSNSPRPRPPLPPRFSSSEAAASMLTKAKEEQGLKTVHLARGVLNGSSPPSVAARYSADRASMDTIGILGIMSPSSMAEQEDAARVLSQIGMSELLELDERPTFVVDLQDSMNSDPGQLRIVFANLSLRTCPGMLELVSGKEKQDLGSSSGSSETSWVQFKAWLLSACDRGESLNACLPSVKFAGTQWSCATLRKRLRIISGRHPPAVASGNISAQNPIGELSSIASISRPEQSAMQSTSTIETSVTEPGDYFGNAAPLSGEQVLPLHNNEVAPSIEVPGAPPLDILNGRKSNSESDISETLASNLSVINECVLRAATAGNVDDFHSPERHSGGFFDWTRLHDSADLPHHVQFARSIDWASTSLGPLETWSADLRQMSNLIMASPHPAAMYWGKDLVAIYNEAYVMLAGQKHPSLMGQPYSEAWAEIWDEVKDVFTTARTTGEATMKVRHAEL